MSTVGQSLDRQTEMLKEYGVRKIFEEKQSGKDLNRQEFQKLLKFIREDDELVITSLDRLSRKSTDLTAIMTELKQKGIRLTILNLPSTQGIEDPVLRELIQNIIVELFKYQAEAEREYIRERQRQGIEIAKAKGKYKGRKLKYRLDSPKLMHAMELYYSGKYTLKEIEELTGIHRRTFYRYRKLLKERNDKK